MQIRKSGGEGECLTMAYPVLLFMKFN